MLKKKVEVTDYVNKNPACSSRKVSNVYTCGKTQTQRILKRRVEMMEELEKKVRKSKETERVG